MLAVLQFLLTPLLLLRGFIPALFSNVLYALALSYYHYLSFLGYSSLPFLEHTEVGRGNFCRDHPCIAPVVHLGVEDVLLPTLPVDMCPSQPEVQLAARVSCLDSVEEGARRDGPLPLASNPQCSCTGCVHQSLH